MHSLGMHQLVLGIDLVRRILPQFADLVSGSLHDLMHAFVQLHVAWVLGQRLPMVVLDVRNVVGFVWKNVGFHSQVGTRSLIKFIQDLFVLI